MKKLIFVLLALSMPMFAQLNPQPGPQPWTCDTTKNLDSQGNVCLTFTTAAHPYQQVTFNQMNWGTENGQPIPAGFYGSLYFNYGNMQSVNIASDPLKVVFNTVPSYGWPSTSFVPTVTTQSSVTNPDGSKDVTYVFQAQATSQTVVLGNTVTNQELYEVAFIPGTGEPLCYGTDPTNGAAQCEQFQWQGTFRVHFNRITLACSGRGGHPPCYGYSTGPGSGEMSAVPSTYEIAAQ